MTPNINEKYLETGSFFHILWRCCWVVVYIHRMLFSFNVHFEVEAGLILLQLFLIIAGVVVTRDKFIASILKINENPGQGENTGNIYCRQQRHGR